MNRMKYTSSGRDAPSVDGLLLRTVVIDDTGWLQVLNDKGLAETVELERFSDLRGVPK